MKPRYRATHTLLAFVLAGTGLQAVQARDYFLTIGGGYSPMGNQVSLEKNVILFSTLLEEQYPAATSPEVDHTILFSDGDDPGRDLQFSDPDFSLPPANALLAILHQNTRYLNYQYRNHEIQDVTAPASRESLEYWFDKTGSLLTGEDRLFLYVTAHGGKGRDDNDPQNTTLYLWNNERLQMRELSRMLDQIPADVPVVMVMVQCYAGGFAHVIFNDGDADQGCSTANRCGFFATVHDRVAAGCTADIREENYHEYSSYFWEAIRGRTRSGQAIESPDYNGDGAVSFDEAHAYALITSITIDVSIKTSDAFLREFSRMSSVDDDLDPPLLNEDSPYSVLIEVASPVDRAVLEGLSEALELSADQRATEVEQLIENAEAQRRQIDGNRRRVNGQLESVCKSLKGRITRRWPELANPWHPAVPTILAEDGAEIVAFAESQRDYRRFRQLRERVSELSAEKMELDRRLARGRRMLRALQNVALAANLPRVADEATVERYQQLLDAEAGAFQTLLPVSSD